MVEIYATILKCQHFNFTCNHSMYSIQRTWPWLHNPKFISNQLSHLSDSYSFITHSFLPMIVIKFSFFSFFTHFNMKACNTVQYISIIFAPLESANLKFTAVFEKSFTQNYNTGIFVNLIMHYI